MRQQTLTFMLLLTSWMAVPATRAGEETGEWCHQCRSQLAAHADCCGTGPVCNDCCGCVPSLQLTAEVLLMGRTGTDPQTLLTADISGVVFPVLQAHHLKPEIHGGLRTELLAHGWFEAGYTGIFEQDDRRFVSIPPLTPGLNNVQYQFFGVTGGASVSYDAVYESELHSGEWNVRLDERWGVVPSLGLRWIHFRDELHIYERVTPTEGVRAKVRNDLVGAHLGLEKTLWNRGDWFEVGTELKIGLFGSYADLYADTHDATGPILRLDRDSETTSLVTEFRVTALWWITPHLALRGGYTGLWLDEIALAPDQSNRFDLNTGQGAIRHNDIAFHGGHLGLELVW